MPDHDVRGIYIAFALGGAAVLFARGLAYWLEWQPMTVRWVGLGCLTLGVIGVFTEISAASGLKALFAVALTCGVYIWQDLGIERREAEEQERKREKLLR